MYRLKGDDHMIAVVLPAYKPDETILEITDRLWTYGCRIVAVDDGSGEAYRGIFEKISDICTVLRHEENRGKGAAIKTALAYIQKEMPECDTVGIMDCDGQHLPEDMITLLECARENPKTLVLGCRSVGKEMPLKSRLGNRITRGIFYLVTGVPVSDTQTGLRAFTSNIISSLLTIKGERYEYETNVLLVMARIGLPFEEIPIHTIYRDKENSTSHFRAVWDSVRIYKDILKFTASSFSSFVLDYLLFSLLMLVFPHHALWILGANVLARIVSAYYNYTMNCSFVFHRTRQVKTAVQYFMLAAFILCMNNVILEGFTQIAGFSVYPAKLCTECLLFGISWLVQKLFIFRRENGSPAACGEIAKGQMKA